MEAILVMRAAVALTNVCNLDRPRSIVAYFAPTVAVPLSTISHQLTSKGITRYKELPQALRRALNRGNSNVCCWRKSPDAAALRQHAACSVSQEHASR
jgi:hypothetical protein